ncbi:MAG TPA: redoxin domain-containing protein [Solirubrobacteraceae bacterium]|nr:redoxin domain-containing protein [Solirubrobacteraceae bacterium]
MAHTPTTLQLPIEGELPALDGATGWLNSEPLTAAAVRGRPVLVQFWTFTCINWLRTVPYIRAWWRKYRGDGLVVLGVHTPEFEVEADRAHVRRAVQERRINYPVAVDSDYRIWRAFGNSYWPALYSVDAEGKIRHHRFGEGEYEYSEIVIQLLLTAAGAADVSRDLVSVEGRGAEAPADWSDLQSPETYIGYERAESFASLGGAAIDRAREYEAPEDLRVNHWALAGEWTIGRQAAEVEAAGGRIIHRFQARDLHLVMGSADESPVRFRVLLDGEPPGDAHGVDTDERGEGVASEPRLYQLIRQPGRIRARRFEIAFLDPGARAYVFTFG